MIIFLFLFFIFPPNVSKDFKQSYSRSAVADCFLYGKSAEKRLIALENIVQNCGLGVFIELLREAVQCSQIKVIVICGQLLGLCLCLRGFAFLADGAPLPVKRLSKPSRSRTVNGVIPASIIAEVNRKLQ